MSHSPDQRIQSIETRLARIEEFLKIEATSSDAQTPPPTKAVPHQAKLKKSSVLGSSNLLAVAAVICFILASTFTIKLALDSGWLTPDRQLGLSLGLGVLLCALGRFLNMIEESYRSYLSAAGCVILFLSSYASSLFFEAVPSTLSVLGTIGSASVTLAFYRFHKSDVFAFVATVGTFLCPLFFQQTLGDSYLLSFYFLTWAAVFSQFSISLKSRTLAILSSYLGLGVYAALTHSQHISEIDELALTIFTLFAQFSIFTGGVFRFSTKNETPLSLRETWFFFPVLCFFYAVTYSFMGILGVQLIPTLGQWLGHNLDSLYGIGLGCFVYLFYYKAKGRLSEIQSLNSGTMVHSFLGIAIFHSGYLTLLPDGARTWLLPSAILLSYIARNRELKFNGVARLLMGAISFFEFVNLLGKLLMESSVDMNHMLSSLSVLSLGFLFYFKQGRNSRSHVAIFLWCFHVLALSLGYRLIEGYGSLAVTGVWGLYAVLILGLGYSQKDAPLAKSSLMILLVVAGKALIYDASQAPSLLRIGCLLLTGATLYGSGYLFRKMNSWNKP